VTTRTSSASRLNSAPARRKNGHLSVESRRDLELLQAVEQNSRVTQRGLASRLGIALGLTNIYLKRLMHKGYIKCITISPNRLAYLITPRGIARKGWLTYEFMQHSLDIYRDVRRHLRRTLQERVVNGQSRIALYKTGEAAELAYLSLRELGLEPIAVFDDQLGGEFLGLMVRDIREHWEVNYDMLIVASLDPSAPIVNELQQRGIPREKLLTLRQ
jgi:DNA-binding Lrp family transcriptional regulator